MKPNHWFGSSPIVDALLLRPTILAGPERLVLVVPIDNEPGGFRAGLDVPVGARLAVGIRA
jgi:hypothetical protein